MSEYRAELARLPPDERRRIERIVQNLGITDEGQKLEELRLRSRPAPTKKKVRTNSSLTEDDRRLYRKLQARAARNRRSGNCEPTPDEIELRRREDAQDSMKGQQRRADIARPVAVRPATPPMKRTKDSFKRLVISAEYVSRHIPGGGALPKQFPDLPKLVVPDDDAEQLRAATRRVMHGWLMTAEQTTIRDDISAMHLASVSLLRKIVHVRWRNLFDPLGLSLPNQLVVPSPFRLLSSRHEVSFTRRDPMVLHYGHNITVKVIGQVPHAEDQAFLFALNQIRKGKMCRLSEKSISFDTTMVEIAKTMRKTNPYSSTTKVALKHSFERLRLCELQWESTNGSWYLGGIIDGASYVAKDGKVTVHLDRLFITAHDAGYVLVKKPALYFRLSNKARLLWVYLLRQRTFTSKANWIRAVSVSKVAHYSGLSGIGKAPAWKSKQLVDEALAELKQHQLVVHWHYHTNSQGDKMLHINSLENDELWGRD